MSESLIVRKILAALNVIPCCKAIKVHGSMYSVGQPDIDGVLNGQSFKFEVKRPGCKPTALQVSVLRQWYEAGSITAVVTSVEEALAALAPYLLYRQEMFERLILGGPNGDV